MEKLLQREGKTAMKLDDLATQLGFKSADALFEVVGKDEFSLRNIENLLRPPEPVLQPDEYLLLKKNPAPINLHLKAGCWWCGHRFADDPAGQVLQARATRRHPGFVTPGQGCDSGPCRWSNFRRCHPQCQRA